MIDDLFCSQCGKLKRRCVCRKDTIKKQNIGLLMQNKGNPELKPLFDTEDEIILYRIFEPYKPQPDIPLEEVDLPVMLQKALKDREITHVYRFQKDAIENIRKGDNVVITAPTGFGKTEAFIIPLLEVIAPGGRGIVVYPTKALARDQETKIKAYASSIGLNTVRFDGDSDQQERRAVFGGNADIILSNPDMVDYHLRNNPSFRRIVTSLRFVVVDELHSYNGLFASNMHYLVKRLSRFSDFQIACASATIANAQEFAEELFERDFTHVYGEHRKGVLNFVMRYTPSVYGAIKDIIKSLPDKKSLIFGNSYKSVETIGWVLNREDIRARVHKSGLPRDLREKVEEDFREGTVKVVVCTPTLELGVDIGDVDVVVSELVNYSQFLQRVGRAGRKGQESVGVVLLRDHDSISTYYKSHPEEYFNSQNYGYVEKMNEEAMKFQLLSMCLEKPLQRSEVRAEWMKTLEWLSKTGLVEQEQDGYVASDETKQFLKNFSMRGIGESVKMFAGDKKVGDRILPIALKELFPGSIIIHNGRRYQSLDLDLDSKEARLEEHRYGSEVTDPLYTSIPLIRRVEKQGSSAIYCSLDITMQVYGYIVRDMFTREKKSTKYIEPVSYTFPTKGFLFSAPFPEPQDHEDFYAGSFHAVEHVLIESSDALTGGGSNQIGGISTPEGDIFIYDATIGGSGLSKLLFERLQKGFEVSREVLRSCDCNRIDGCPKCTYSYQCGNNNQPLNRLGALNVLSILLKGGKREVEPEKYEEVVDFKYYPG
ncbi:MAG: DEAD/DEAH box helicase [Candidatus Hadarchaeota archaeon]